MNRMLGLVGSAAKLGLIVEQTVKSRRQAERKGICMELLGGEIVMADIQQTA